MGQRRLTLSSKEAEYIIKSEVAKEVKFIAYLLMYVGVEVKLLVMVN
jgi:hypothetical protein